MTLIINQKVYTFLSATDNFILATLATNGKYTETFKKDEINTVLAGKNEIVPQILYEKSVFDNTADERDSDGTWTEKSDRRS